MNYFENQTELKAYKDLGVTHYLYFATRDSRTSAICSVMDHERFEVSKAQPGVNYPPMHPQCRSGTIPDLEFEDDYRIYKNPITGERVKTNLSYDEWLSKIEDNAKKLYNVDRDKILDTFDASNFKANNLMDLENLKKVITASEASLIREYSGNLYKPINEYLRSGIGTDEIKLKSQQLNKAVRKTQLREDAILKRGVSGKTLKQLGIKGLGEHTLSGMTSTTVDPETSKIFMNSKLKRKVYFEMIAPKNTKGMYIEELSHYKNEKEFLLPHKTKITIESIEEKEDYTHVKARIIK